MISLWSLAASLNLLFKSLIVNFNSYILSFLWLHHRFRQVLLMTSPLPIPSSVVRFSTLALLIGYLENSYVLLVGNCDGSIYFFKYDLKTHQFVKNHTVFSYSIRLFLSWPSDPSLLLSIPSPPLLMPPSMFLVIRLLLCIWRMIIYCLHLWIFLLLPRSPLFPAQPSPWIQSMLHATLWSRPIIRPCLVPLIALTQSIPLNLTSILLLLSLLTMYTLFRLNYS